MLTEIEEQILKILRERVDNVRGENITIGVNPSNLPAVTVSNLGFKLEKSGLSETFHETKTSREERFNIDGVQTVYRLREKPVKEGFRVECPPGVLLAEGADFTVDAIEGTVTFIAPPPKTRKRAVVSYFSETGLAVKGMKVSARYFIDAWAPDRTETDLVAEKVVKALLGAEEQLALEGINATPLQGRTVGDEGRESPKRVRLFYLFERELRFEQPVPRIERIRVVGKKPSTA